MNKVKLLFKCYTLFVKLQQSQSVIYSCWPGKFANWTFFNQQDFNIGLGMMFVSMNIASVKSTGRHSFTLITPYRTFKWVFHYNVFFCLTSTHFVDCGLVCPVSPQTPRRRRPRGWRIWTAWSAALCPTARWLIDCGRVPVIKCALTVVPPTQSGLQWTCWWSSVRPALAHIDPWAATGPKCEVWN